MPDYGTAFATVALFLLLGFGLAVPVLVILRAWIVDATLSAGLALLALAGTFSAFCAIWTVHGTAWVFLWIAAVAAGSMVLPAVSAHADKRTLRQMTNENIARYLQAIERDPRNAAAHAYLADAYLECGRVEEAVAAYEQAIALDPAHSQVERAKLQRALAARAGKASSHIIVCDHCQHEAPAGAKRCPRCGTAMRMSFLEWLAQPESIRAVGRRSFVALLVLTVLYTIVSALPLPWKGCVLIAAIFVGAFYFLRGVGGEV